MNWHPHTPDILVIANGEFPSDELFRSHLETPKAVVAVDGGVVCCARAGVMPDLITGDFDSIPEGFLIQFNKVPLLPTPYQDETDLEKALQFLFTFPIEQVTVLGALGKRLDHTLTNIYLLARYPKQVVYESDNERVMALPRTATFTCRKGQLLSLIPLGLVKGITTKGLKWDLDHDVLNKEFIGVSNLCMQEKISIAYEEGDLILTLEKNV